MAAKKADDTSLADVYRDHATSLRKILHARQSSEADDVVQEVFIRLLASGAHARLDRRRDPIPYLVTVARNLQIDLLRSARRRLLRFQPVGLSTPLAEISSRDAQPAAANDEFCGLEQRLELIARYARALPAPMSAIYEARFVRGLPQRKAAAALAITRRRIRTLERRLIVGALQELGHQRDDFR